MAMTVFDCARVPEEKTCSVKIVGERDDVVQAAYDHLVSTHESKDPDLKAKITRVVEEHQTTYGVWGH